VGCGTGALSETILEQCAPAHVLGLDSSTAYAAHAQSRLGGARAEFRVGDAQALSLPQRSRDAAVSGLVLNFLPHPDHAVAGMTRSVQPGGPVAAYVWDYAGQMQLMRHFWDAAVALDPAAGLLDEGRRFPLCQPGALRLLFEQAGLRDVAVRAIDVPTVFRDFDDYWSPFLGGQAPAPGYCMSLPEERRLALRERIRAGLPMAADGTIALMARAWAVRETVP
jgi:SAM-dependent methyltransferase